MEIGRIVPLSTTSVPRPRVLINGKWHELPPGFTPQSFDEHVAAIEADEHLKDDELTRLRKRVAELEAATADLPQLNDIAQAAMDLLEDDSWGEDKDMRQLETAVANYARAQIAKHEAEKREEEPPTPSVAS